MRENNPKLFDPEEINYEKGIVGKYTDYEISMRVNNCTKEAIQKKPCFYLALNYEMWDRNLLRNYKKK